MCGWVILLPFGWVGAIQTGHMWATVGLMKGEVTRTRTAAGTNARVRAAAVVGPAESSAAWLRQLIGWALGNSWQPGQVWKPWGVDMSPVPPVQPMERARVFEDDPPWLKESVHDFNTQRFEETP
jgi:hypothetical protein